MIHRAVAIALLVASTSFLLLPAGSGSQSAPREAMTSSSAVEAAQQSPAEPALAPVPDVIHPLVVTPQFKVYCQNSAPGLCIGNPPGITEAKAVWDNATTDKYVLLLGGLATGSAFQNGTYKWVKGNWSTLQGNGQTSATGYSKVANLSVTMDDADHYVLIFGGRTGAGTYSNQTVRYVNGVFTKFTHQPGSAPSSLTSRGGSCLAYIPAMSGGKGNFTLLYGGSGVNVKAFGDTWKWTAAAGWSNITASAGPAPTSRANTMCSWDPSAKKVDLFGGIHAKGTVFNDLWQFDPTANTTGGWSQVIANNTAGSPPPRQFGAFSYDPIDGYDLLVGGGKGDQYNSPSFLSGGEDAWTLIGTTWSNVTMSAIRPNLWTNGIWGAAAAYAPNYDFGFYYGGTVSATNFAKELGIYGKIVKISSLSFAPAVPIAGHTVWINATVQGGTGLYAYNWSGLPDGCPANTNASSLACLPVVMGPYNASLNLTDSAGMPPQQFPAVSQLFLNITNGTLATLNGQLLLGGPIGSHGTTFFGQVNSPPFSSGYTGGVHPDGPYLNSTPIHTFRIGGGGLGYDPTTNLNWVPPGSGSGAYVSTGTPPVNWTDWKRWCTSVTAGCSWLFYLPAIVNNTTFAVYTAKWFHQTLGLAPIWWEFGNEPNAWTHYGKNYSTWNTADNSPVTGAAYATMVRNYVTAIRAVFPNDKYIGLEAASAGNSNLFTPLVASDYSYINALAWHQYPTGPTSGSALLNYFGALAGGAGIPSKSAQIRTYLTSNCGGNATCLALPIQIGEYNGGPATNFSYYDSLFQGAVFIGASAIQAIASNVSSFQFFNLGRLNDPTAGPTFDGLLYQRILANLTLGSFTAANVTGPGGIYAIVGRNGTHDSLFLVNTNVTSNALVTDVAFSPGAAGRVYSWKNGQSAPTNHAYIELPPMISLPAESLVLVNDFNGPPVLSPSISVAPSVGGVGTLFYFNSTVSGGVGPFLYSWSFGDGNTASGGNATHVYLTCGFYTPSLSVADNSGQNVTVSTALTIVCPAVAVGLAAFSGAVYSVPPIFWLLLAAAAAIAVITIESRRRRSRP